MLRTAMCDPFDSFDIFRRGLRTLFGRRNPEEAERLETAQNVVAAVITAGVILAVVGLLVGWFLSR